MPPVTVSGTVLIAGSPAPECEVRLIIPDPYFRRQLAAALVAGREPPESYAYSFTVCRTNQQGDFTCSLPGHTRSVGGPAFPGSTVLLGKGDDLIFQVQVEPFETLYQVRSAKESPRIEVWDHSAGDFRRAPGDAFVRVTIKRAAETDHVDLSLVKVEDDV